MRLLNPRYLLGRLHLWLGLALALYAVVIGLTGAILVFREDLSATIHPQLHTGPPPKFKADLDAAMHNLQLQYPGYRPLSISWPHEGTPYWMVYAIKGPQALEIYLDTNSGQIVGASDPRGDWLGITESIHNNFRFGRDGRLANGYGALGLILLTLTGLYLLWPRFKLILIPRHWGRSRELHYLLGVTTFLFLLGLSITGAYYTWPKPFLDFAKSSLGRTPDLTLPPLPGNNATLPLRRLVEIAQQSYPQQAIHRFPMPDTKYPLRITFREGTFAEFHLVSSVTLDPRTGAILRVQNLTDRPAGDTFLGWLSAFHMGNFGGRVIQILWALIGIAIAALGPTGVWIWWRKR